MTTEGLVRRWGRAAGLAALSVGLVTLVQLVTLFLVAAGTVSGDVVGETLWAYFGAMGIIGGGAQLPNVAERLPGRREWDRAHDYDGRRPEGG